jgi:hypothetical protein
MAASHEKQAKKNQISFYHAPVFTKLSIGWVFVDGWYVV